MQRLVAGCDIVFHQAALRITHCAAEPRAALRGDGRRHLRPARALRRSTRCARWSPPPRPRSTAWRSSFPTTEAHHPYDNRTLYGAAKLFSEGLLRAFNDMYGLDYVALRYFNVYGPRMDIHGRYTEVLVRWMERIEAGEPPIIFGDGLQTMDFVHVARRRARQHPGGAGAGDRRASSTSAAGPRPRCSSSRAQLAAAMGRPDLAPVHEAERAVNPVPRRLADTERGRGASSASRPQVALRGTGSRDLVAWWRAERAGPSPPERRRHDPDRPAAARRGGGRGGQRGRSAPAG